MSEYAQYEPVGVSWTTHGESLWVLCGCGRVFQGRTPQACARARRAMERHTCAWRRQKDKELAAEVKAGRVKLWGQ